MTDEVAERSRREEIVASQMRVFRDLLHSEFQGTEGIKLLEAFAGSAEDIAHRHSRQAQEALKEDEGRLSNHANHMRAVSAYIVLLRGGQVPALKIHPDSHEIREQAIWSMNFIRAHFFAMECGHY